MGEKVCAVVVTYNRRALLTECLRALGAQTRAVDQIVVADNASTDGTREMLAAEFPKVHVLALTDNLGGAGGFHEGMRWAHGQDGKQWLWLMDDDGRPAPDCLARLLDHARPDRVLVPLQRNDTGELYGAFRWRGGWKHLRSGPYVNVTAEVATAGQPVSGDYLFTFVGALVPGEVVHLLGLPHKEYFIYFDDIEYALRVRARGDLGATVVPQAIFYHDWIGTQKRPVRVLGRFGKARPRVAVPLWKMYYDARNYLYTITRTTRRPADLYRYFAWQLWAFANDLLLEPDHIRRAFMRLRGIRDGMMGRLGKRVLPGATR